jgi:hypothetical protein
MEGVQVALVRKSAPAFSVIAKFMLKVVDLLSKADLTAQVV